MNTRLQVEHPVTEAVTGLDLVREQILVAGGAPLGFAAVETRGHAIECRLYSEDPAHGFLPATGTIHVLAEPSGAWVRFDSGVAVGSRVGVDYDPLLAKLSVYGATREEARTRMLAALRETVLLGVVTNRDYLAAVLAHPAFAAGSTYTEFLAEHPRVDPDGGRAPPRHRRRPGRARPRRPVARRDGAGDGGRHARHAVGDARSLASGAGAMSTRKTVVLDGAPHVVEVSGRDDALVAQVDERTLALAIARDG
jgi:acetyl/propionyl-CoA carboxylase alpha subunit